MSLTAPAPAVSPSFGARERSGPAFDLPMLAAVFRRRWPLFCAVALSVAAAVILFSLFLTPVYQAQANVRIDPTERTVLDQQALANGRTPDSALVDTEVAVIASRQVAQDVVRRLELTEDPEFGRAPGTAVEKEQAAVEAVLDRLSVQRLGDTYIVGIAFSSERPAKAARIANAFAQAYMDVSVRSNVAQSTQQSSALNQQLEQVAAQVRAADARVAQYQAATGLVSGGAAGTAVDQQLTTIAGQLGQAQSSAAAARARARAAQRQVRAGNLEAVPEVLSSAVVTDLRRQRTEVVRQEAELGARYGPRHPSAVQVREQLQQIDSDLRLEAERIVGGLLSEAGSAEARAASLQAQLNALRAQQARNAEASVQADALRREAESSRSIYDRLAQAAQQTTQQRRLTETPGRVVAFATPPASPSFPNRPLFAALALMLGAAAGASAVIAAETLQRGVQSAQEIESDIGADFLGSIPELSAADWKGVAAQASPSDHVLRKPMSVFSESLRNLRSAILLRTPATQGGRVICITSAVPGEGKSVLTFSLARILGMGGERVLVLDCDLRRSAIPISQAAGRTGLVEVLRGEGALSESLVADDVENVSVLPVRQARYTPEDVFGGGRMERLLVQARAQFDIVLVDCPPVLAVADAQTLSGLSDSTVLLARWKATPRDAVRTAARLVTENGRLAGIALSRVDPSARSLLGPNDPAAFSKYSRDYFQS